MKLRIHNNQMEEVEGLCSEYPYAFHHVLLQNTLVPWHWHEALEFDYVVSGSVSVSTTTHTHTFHAGEGFFINSNVLTTMVNVHACVMDSHLFHPVFLCGHFKSVFETKYLNPVLQNRSLELLPIRGDSPTQQQLLLKLRQLAQLQSRQNTEFQTRNTVSEIWILLLEHLKDTTVPAVTNRNRDRLLTMMAYIHDNYMHKISLDEIADSAAVSVRECLRCFRDSIHTSPTEYLIDYRVRAAAKLLENTELSITQIALETGWGSSAYFSKMFRRILGDTPNSYRKSRRTNKQ